MTKKLRLGILLSGGGTTFLNIDQRIKEGRLDAEVTCVVSSRSKVAGLQHARDLGYPAHFVGRRRFDSDDAYSAAITQILDDHQVDLIVLAGFLRKYYPAEHYSERCINIHPALLPAFGGQGFYGMNVHRAVWQRSCRVSGCTVHLVTENYDEGPIIVQRACEITSEDTPEDIRRKVFEQECEAYPEAISLFAAGQIRFEDGRALISS